MSKHTPGPWIYIGNGDIVARSENYCGGEKDIASVFLTANDEDEANARLIAAAPELLEALQNLSIVMQELHDHWDNDRDMKVGKGLLALSSLLPGYDKRIDVIHAAIAKATGGNNV